MRLYRRITVMTMALLITLGSIALHAESGNDDVNDDLIGTWSYSGGSIEFLSDGSGVMALKNLNPTAPCPEGSVTRFNWNADDSHVTLNYTSMVICGEVQDTPGSDGPKKYNIQGNSLQFAGLTWSRQ